MTDNDEKNVPATMLRRLMDGQKERRSETTGDDRSRLHRIELKSQNEELLQERDQMELLNTELILSRVQVELENARLIEAKDEAESQNADLARAMIEAERENAGLVEAKEAAESQSAELVQAMDEARSRNVGLVMAKDEAEKTLENYAELYDLAPICSVTLAGNGTVIAVNRAGATLLGVAPSQLVGSSFGQLIRKQQRVVFADFLARVLANGSKERCEVTLCSPEVPRLIARIEAIAGDEGRECRLALVDVTAQRRAEEALRAHENRICRLAQKAADAVVMMDDSATVTFCNSAAERMFGRSRAEIVGGDFHRIFFFPPAPGADGQSVVNGRGQGLWPEFGKTIEITALGKDAGEFPLELTLYALKLQKKWHAIGVMRNLTERRLLESRLLQAQKMETIGLMAGGIAHDFNNILNVIAGFGSISEMKMGEDDPWRADLKKIISAAGMGANLTRSLLNFCRKQQPTRRPADLRAIVGEVKTFLALVVGEKVRLETAYADRALMVAADSGQLERVMINLAINARHAMPDGGRLTIAVEAFHMDPEFVMVRRFGEPGDYALLSVTDNGAGMDQEIAGKIFLPFFSTKTAREGTGLGLSIVQTIVREHGGFIEVSSEPGEGTAFRIYLPLMVESPVPGQDEFESERGRARAVGES